MKKLPEVTRKSLTEICLNAWETDKIHLARKICDDYKEQGYDINDFYSILNKREDEIRRKNERG